VELLESVWSVQSLHVEDSTVVELRQGVGLRQETGATAGEGHVLFDQETLPVDLSWGFQLEIDTLRGGPEVEALTLLCLSEWAEGRCWLGAGVARGTGWLTLQDCEVLRLPLTEPVLTLWPDNRIASWVEVWDRLAAQEGTFRTGRLKAEGLRHQATRIHDHAAGKRGFWYLTLDFSLSAGAKTDGYGWDPVSVGGHDAGLTEKDLSGRFSWLKSPGLEAPGIPESYECDLPLQVTRRNLGNGQPEVWPHIAGSSLRGPLRHHASRVARGVFGEEVSDPNVSQLSDKTQERPVSGPALRLPGARTSLDELLGSVACSSRLLVRDAQVMDPDAVLLALCEHHAEDEFTAGTYHSAKFNRSALIQGTFNARIVLEAETVPELCAHIQAMAPVLLLAELGRVPLGRAKQAGLGWICWQLTEAVVAQAGHTPRLQVQGSVKRALEQVLEVLTKMDPDFRQGQPA
jgi:CRISPR/Cas system CSM-associated protein Csm3 (group 7 of RAMP superfamily)